MFLRPDGPQRDAIPNVWVRVGVGVPLGLGLGFGLADPFVRTNEPAVTCGQVTTNRWTVTSSTFVVGIAFFGIVTGNREWHSSPLNSHCKPRHRRRRLGYGARVACPPTKNVKNILRAIIVQKSENLLIFSTRIKIRHFDKYHTKFGHFVKISFHT